MKAYGGVDVYIHIFLTLALAGGEWSASRPGRFTPGERAPSTHWIGGWVNPKSGLDDVEKRKFLPLPGLELRPLGYSARSQSLYQLCCPGSHMYSILKEFIFTTSELVCSSSACDSWSEGVWFKSWPGHQLAWRFSWFYSISPDSPPSLLCNGYWGLFSQGQSSWSMKLTAHNHVVPRSRLEELYIHSPICLNGMVFN
jgi:hypothetical protein